jgi:hypothetical protein
VPFQLVAARPARAPRRVQSTCRRQSFSSSLDLVGTALAVGAQFVCFRVQQCKGSCGSDTEARNKSKRRKDCQVLAVGVNSIHDTNLFKWEDKSAEGKEFLPHLQCSREAEAAKESACCQCANRPGNSAVRCLAISSSEVFPSINSSDLRCIRPSSESCGM